MLGPQSAPIAEVWNHESASNNHKWNRKGVFTLIEITTVSNAKPPSWLTTHDFHFDHFLPEICRPKNETYTITQVQVRIWTLLVLGTSKYLNIREDITICLNNLFCFDKICSEPFSVGSPSPHASAYKMKWNLNTSINTILHYCCGIRSLCSNQLNCITFIKVQQEMMRTSHIQVLLQPQVRHMRWALEQVRMFL